MEIYKNLDTPASQEFTKLLNNQLSKINIEEGKIIEGKINKVTEVCCQNSKDHSSKDLSNFSFIRSLL